MSAVKSSTLDGLDLLALERFFAEHIPGFSGRLSAELLRVGRSNLTCAPPWRRRWRWPPLTVHRRRVRRKGLPDDPARRLTIRQAAYDPPKLRGQNLIDKPRRTRRYQVAPGAVRNIAALLTFGDHVTERILAGIRSPAGSKPARSSGFTWG
jgi:hypothetical protein